MNQQAVADYSDRAARKRPLLRRVVLMMAAFLLLFVLGANTVASSSLAVPTMTVTSVTTDTSVTVTGVNFPHDQTFTVRMGEMGTLGVGGLVVDTFGTGNSSTFTRTFTIPAGLVGRYQISIRLDSAQGYYSYNWFYNNTTGTAPAPSTGYTGIPTIAIVSVDADNTVTIRTNNYPPGQTFTVTMGPMFSRGIGGTVVGTFDSGAGGSLEKTFDIPDALQGSSRIAIRAQTAHANPYYSFNWFYNNTTDGGDDGNGDDNGDDGGTGGGEEPTTVYTGIPTFKVCAVTRNETVEIVTNNFPANQTFTVTMGPMFTQGIGGTVVGTISSGDGGTITQSFEIPDYLAGSYRISVRAQTAHAYPYYAYNWFYNNTADVCP